MWKEWKEISSHPSVKCGFQCTSFLENPYFSTALDTNSAILVKKQVMKATKLFYTLMQNMTH